MDATVVFCHTICIRIKHITFQKLSRICLCFQALRSIHDFPINFKLCEIRIYGIVIFSVTDNKGSHLIFPCICRDSIEFHTMRIKKLIQHISVFRSCGRFFLRFTVIPIIDRYIADHIITDNNLEIQCDCYLVMIDPRIIFRIKQSKDNLICSNCYTALLIHGIYICRYQVALKMFTSIDLCSNIRNLHFRLMNLKCEII